MEAASARTVTKIIRTHREALGLAQVKQVETALLGQGEANLNVLVTVNGQHTFNLRIGLRNEESEQNLQSEFNILQLVPDGVGPRAFLIDFTRTHLAQPYMLLEYMEGISKREWSTADLKLHARTLARLHRPKFEHHGAVGRLTEAPYDFLYRFDVALNYWQTHQPHLFDISVVQRLLPPIRRFVIDHNTLFTSLRRFAIVHGDMHPLNVLFNGDQVRYIDWEWASIGDPAHDVATIGWDIATAWQFELTGERLDNFLATYLALEPDDTLLQRRDVWMVFTMFFDQMYHRTQIPNDTTGRQAHTVQQIETYLSNRFL